VKEVLVTCVSQRFLYHEKGNLKAKDSDWMISDSLSKFISLWYSTAAPTTLVSIMEYVACGYKKPIFQQVI